MRKLLVLLAAIAFVAAFTAPAFAAEWSFYGHARMYTFWTDTDFGDYMGPTDDEDFDLSHTLQGNSRIGANVKASDNLVGRFEYGVTGQTTGSHLAARVRLLYGEYDFGGWKLLVGRAYAPVCIFISNQVYGEDMNMLNVGGIYSGRQNMVQAKFGNFKIALIEPSTPSMGATDTDVTIPKIEAKYTFNAGNLGVQLAGGYETYDVVDALDDEEDVSAYIVGLGLTYNAGPFFLGGDVWIGQNVGNYGMAVWGIGNGNAAIDAAGDIRDNDGYGFLGVLGFNANEALRLEGGIGYTNYDLDDAAEEDESLAYYLQAKITFAKGVFIVPEIGYYDLKEDFGGADQGDITYYGLQWQIRF